MSKQPTTADETEALRDVVRQAHEAIKDLTRLNRECRETIATMRVAAAITVNDRIQAAVDEGIRRYDFDVGEAINAATDKVFARFQRIEETLLGETAEQAAKRPTVPEISEVWQEALGLVRAKQREVTPTIESKYL